MIGSKVNDLPFNDIQNHRFRQHTGKVEKVERVSTTHWEGGEGGEGFDNTLGRWRRWGGSFLYRVWWLQGKETLLLFQEVGQMDCVL